MARIINFEYDPQKNILFTRDDYDLNTEQDVDDFIAINLAQLEKLGRKVYVISRIDGLRVAAPVSEYYGRKARGVFEKHILGLVRYGEDPAARMTVRTASRKAQLESNIFNTREEAVAAVEKMKQQAA
jgi:hypothetical protein